MGSPQGLPHDHLPGVVAERQIPEEKEQAQAPHSHLQEPAQLVPEQPEQQQQAKGR